MNSVLITKLGLRLLLVQLNFTSPVKLRGPCYQVGLRLAGPTKSTCSCISLSLSLLFLVSTLDSFVFCVYCSCFRWFCVVCHTHHPTKAFLFQCCSLVFGALWRWRSGFLELWLLGFLWDCFCSCWISWSGGRWDLGKRKPFRVVGGGGGGGVSGTRRKIRRRWGG